MSRLSVFVLMARFTQLLAVRKIRAGIGTSSIQEISEANNLTASYVPWIGGGRDARCYNSYGMVILEYIYIYIIYNIAWVVD